MTSNKRCSSLRALARWAVGGALAAPLLVALAACYVPPAEMSDEVSECPEGYYHVEIEIGVYDHASDVIGGRDVVIVLAAQAIDPEYAGIYVVGEGVTRQNPVVREIKTRGDDDPPVPGESPVVCVPADKAVALMVRVSMQHPATAHEQVECELINRGIAGVGPLIEAGSRQGRVAIDTRTVETADMIDPERWYVAQCDWLSIPDGINGPYPELFPRPDQV
jgi:hypothetical protein